MSPAFEFLQRAERYVEEREHLEFFQWVYTNHREYYSIVDSVWKTLSYMYSNEVADQLEFQ